MTVIKEFKKKNIFGVYEVSTDGFIYKRNGDRLNIYCDWTDVPWMFTQIVPERVSKGLEVWDLISALKRAIENRGYYLTLKSNEN